MSNIKLITIKKITIDEVLPIRHKVLWPEKTIDYVRVKNDSDGTHYGLFLNDSLVSVISVFITQEEAQYRKFATLSEHQGQGYGSILFEHMLSTLKETGIKRIWCNARSDANNFYLRYGFKNASSDIFQKYNVSYTIMEKLF